ESIVVVDYDVVASGYVGGDNGFRGACGFQQGAGCSLPVRRKHDAIRIPDKRSNIERCAEILDRLVPNPLADDFGFDAAFVFGFHGAEDLKSGVEPGPAKHLHCINEIKNALVGNKARYQQECKIRIALKWHGLKFFKVNA